MSKTQLKKVLVNLDRDQLQALVLEVYEARKEAKEFLDFFVDPDVDKMMGKYKGVIDKELGRVSRGRARPRMTRLRKAVKDFASFNPGGEFTGEIMTYLVERFCATGSDCWIKDTTQRSMAKFLSETLVFIDKNELIADFLPRITRAVESMKSGFFHNNTFKRLLKETIEDFQSLR